MFVSQGQIAKRLATEPAAPSHVRVLNPTRLLTAVARFALVYIIVMKLEASRRVELFVTLTTVPYLFTLMLHFVPIPVGFVFIHLVA